MKRNAAVLWWPPMALLAMVVLGLVVGKGTTPVDYWFTSLGETHLELWWLLVLTDWRLTVGVLIVCAAVAVLHRRWRLVATVVVAPVVAITSARLLKGLFGRESEGQLAYPSGHSTVLVVVLGLVVLVVGASTWSIAVAIVIGLLGLLGQAVTYHYFTDTVGAVLLGTTLLCLVAVATKLDRRQAPMGSASQ